MRPICWPSGLHFCAPRVATHEDAVKQAAFVASLSAAHCKAISESVTSPVTPLLPASDKEDLIPEPPSHTRCVVAVPPEFSLGDFVSSWQKRSDFKRLHRVGDCPLRPGVDFLSFIVHGPSEPAAIEYTVKCKRCFRFEPASTNAATDSSASSSCSE